MQERRREGERGNEKGKDGEGGVWGLSCGKICYYEKRSPNDITHNLISERALGQCINAFFSKAPRLHKSKYAKTKTVTMRELQSQLWFGISVCRSRQSLQINYRSVSHVAVWGPGATLAVSDTKRGRQFSCSAEPFPACSPTNTGHCHPLPQASSADRPHKRASVD